MQKNGLVTIFGGIMTKEKHYRRAIEVYAKQNYDVHFYEAGCFGLSSVIPSKFQDNVLRAVERASSKQQQQNLIVHVNSGGLWSGLLFNRLIPQKTFIIESGPLNCRNSPQLIDSLNKNYTKLPFLNGNKSKHSRAFMEAIMNRLGIPNVNNPKDFEWFEAYDRDLHLLQNVHLLYGLKDDLLDLDFIQNFQNHLKHPRRGISVVSHTFDNASHHNVNRALGYQERIRNIIVDSK